MEMTQLQVSITAEQMTRLKATARQSGSTMTMLVREWIEGLGDSDGVVVTSSPTSSSGTSRYEELLEQLGQMAQAMQEQSRVQAEVQAAQVKALEAQTALLERLTQQGGLTPPHGGTEVTRVVVTPSEDARPVISTKFTGFEDYTQGQGKAPATEPPVPLPAKGPSLLERMQTAAVWTDEQVGALAPCEARVLFVEDGYEPLSEEVVVRLASGDEVKGQATGQVNGWVQVKPSGDWPEGGRNAQNIAAPLAACVWSERVEAGEPQEDGVVPDQATAA
jgi:hypothetical protein